MRTVNRKLFFLAVLIFVGVLASMLMIAVVAEVPVYGEAGNPTNNYVMRRYIDKGIEESGGYNMVTNIVLDYRGYDTLLESTVLFTSVMAIILVLGVNSTSEDH